MSSTTTLKSTFTFTITDDWSTGSNCTLVVTNTDTTAAANAIIQFTLPTGFAITWMTGGTPNSFGVGPRSQMRSIWCTLAGTTTITSSTNAPLAINAAATLSFGVSKPAGTPNASHLATRPNSEGVGSTPNPDGLGLSSGL